MLERMQADAFDQVFSIMERSFPADEYRTYEEQKGLLSDARYQIYVCSTHSPKSRNIASFLAVWQFEDFVFVEHFAADPAVRGQGLGSAVLHEAVRMFPHQICLEVEPPETDMAKRRIAFYVRNGFCLNSYPYVQPPISKGKKELPLMIMSSGAGITEDRFEKIRDELYREVYNCRQTDAVQYGQDEIQQAVSQADEADVRRFLTQVLHEDPQLFHRFRFFASHEISEADMERYKKRMHAAVQKYLGKDGLISGRGSVGFVQEMEGFLTEDVRMMLEESHDVQAFELASWIFTETAAVDMDDSEGAKGVLGAQCLKIWKEILERADSCLQRQMYDWFTGQLDRPAVGHIEGYMEEYMEQVLMEAFTDGEYLEEKLAFTRRKAKEEKAGSDSWSTRYHTQKWALRHIGLMEESGSAFADIVTYCREYWEYEKIRKYYITKCIEQQKYADAINALQESIRMDAGMPGLVREFSTMLKEVYRRSGRQEEYRRQLWQLVTKDHAGNLELFRELRTLYSREEWQAVRETLFQELPPQAHVECLYKEEGLYDKLLEFVLQEKGMYAVQQYQGILREIYPQQLLEKYEDELKNIVQRAADRRHYQEWAAVLRRMLQIPGGQEKVQAIVADWKFRYKNRPAMMEELKQF